MQLHFDNSIVNVIFNNTPLSLQIQRAYRHLQNLPVIFKPWDNPYYVKHMDPYQLALKLVEFGKKVGVEVDFDRCLTNDQNYLNFIHKIYEQKYDGDPRWLDFHEHIHMCEKTEFKDATKPFVIDYREKAGLLEKKFDIEWIKHTTTQVKAGDVYVQWAELGKTPYKYWENGEPNDINRICELAKPWLKLRCKISIAIEDFDFTAGVRPSEFNQWWNNYQHLWCHYWGISSWGLKEMFSVSVIGQVSEFDLFKSNVQKQKSLTKIQI